MLEIITKGQIKGPNTDPFLRDGETVEDRVSILMQEWLLELRPPDNVYRQGGEGYALTVAKRKGERLLTIPSSNEADFVVHGNRGTTVDSLADFVAEAIHESGANHLRLPLLSEEQAERLQKALRERLAEWRVAIALSAITPLARKPKSHRLPAALQEALSIAEKKGHAVARESSLPLSEIRAIHGERWGWNRDDAFFEMLARMVASDCAEVITLRTPDGTLASAVVDVPGSVTRHLYYSISDTKLASGSGMATLAASWRRFLECGNEEVYSFGRGTEAYKFKYADTYREFYELRGFFLPIEKDHAGASTLENSD